MDITLSELSPGFSVLPVFLWVWLALVVAVHVGFTACVARDAHRIEPRPLIAGPLLWTLATLITGILGAGLYWAVNHSTLSRREEGQRAPEEGSTSGRRR